MNPLLAPFGWAYGRVMEARNAAYDAGWFRTSDVGVPVIAVGNLTAGGTGKTPLVEHLLRLLVDEGRQPAMVSRGYGRSTRGVLIVSNRGEIRARYPESGDEPAQIAMKFPRASVVVGEHRVDAAQTAIRECGADVIVLDDAFQHRSIHRDLNILVLESGRDIGREGVIPAGRLRERPQGVGRADLVGFSGSGEGGVPAWAKALVPGDRAFTFRQCITGFAGIDGDVSVPAGHRVFAFSGIGRPDGFAASLREAGAAIAGEKQFRDHHPFTEADLRTVAEKAAVLGVSTVVTTEKDAARIGGSAEVFRRRGLTLAWSRSSIAMLSGGEMLARAVQKACGSQAD